MRRTDLRKFIAFAAVVLVALGSAVARYLVKGGRWPAGDSIPLRVEDFTLLDQNGVSRTLYRSSDKKAIVLVAHRLGSPEIARAGPILADLQLQYQDVEILFVDPTDELSRTGLLADPNLQKWKIPVLMDASQVVTRALGLGRVSEVLIVEPKDWKVVYSGGVGETFRSTISELAHGRVPASPIRGPPSDGDPLALAERSKPDYRAHIVPILKHKCLYCHLSDYPANLAGYDKLKKFEGEIRRQILLDRMPPFSADPFYGKYLNDATLEPREKRTLMDWLDNGAPSSAGDDPLLELVGGPRKRPHPMIGKTPIYSVDMKETVPAGGHAEYSYAQLGGAIPADMWINGMRQRSSHLSPSLRHATLYIASKPLDYYLHKARTGKFPDRCYDSSIYMLGALEPEFERDINFNRIPIWGPTGDFTPMFSIARKKSPAFLPKGYYLILETYRRGLGHEIKTDYHLDFFGRFHTDGRRIIHGSMIRSREVTIPPGIKSYILETEPRRFRGRPVGITGMMVHMHSKGRSVKLVEQTADGQARVFASVPNFHYGLFVHMILLPVHPVRIAGDSSIKAVCEFDSVYTESRSTDPRNRMREAVTKSGTEMCNISLQYVFDD